MANDVATLSTLAEWSVRHIKDIFEGDTYEDSLRSISATFADDVVGTVNGSPLSREGIDRLVLGMKENNSSAGLKVHWEQLVEVPRDPSTNRDGSFGGYYVIRGLRKRLPGNSGLAEFERHKMVTVQIASQSADNIIDSRRIVNLAFVASDVKVDHEKA